MSAFRQKKTLYDAALSIPLVQKSGQVTHAYSSTGIELLMLGK